MKKLKNWQKIRQNSKLVSQFLVREQVVDEIRRFFKSKGFHEVETPLMVERPSTETFLEFFDTTLKMADGQTKTGFFITSPEYAMKKLLVAGLGNIFQITKSFRNNEGDSFRHNPEFLILEWYRTKADYTQIMTDFEQLMIALVKKIRQPEKTKPLYLIYQGKQYNLTPPWPRLSVAEAFERFVGLDANQLLSREELMAEAVRRGYAVTNETTWEEVYNQLFLNEIDPRLAELKTPVFLYDYPASQAALSRRKKSDPRFAERFEVYIAGIELGNAFSELTDAKEQEARLRADLQLRAEMGRKQYELDEDFIDALKAGMPETGGIAVGVDRLIMLLADTPSIHDIMFFPVHDVFDIE